MYFFGSSSGVSLEYTPSSKPWNLTANSVVISSSASSIFFFFSFFGRGAPLATDPTDSRRIVDVCRPHADDVRRPPKIDIERPGCESFVDVRRDAATLLLVLRAPSETADDWADGSGGAVDECFAERVLELRQPAVALLAALLRRLRRRRHARCAGAPRRPRCRAPMPRTCYSAPSRARAASASAGWLVRDGSSTVTPRSSRPELKRRTRTRPTRRPSPCWAASSRWSSTRRRYSHTEKSSTTPRSARRRRSTDNRSAITKRLEFLTAAAATSALGVLALCDNAAEEPGGSPRRAASVIASAGWATATRELGGGGRGEHFHRVVDNATTQLLRAAAWRAVLVTLSRGVLGGDGGCLWHLGGQATRATPTVADLRREGHRPLRGAADCRRRGRVRVGR